MPAKRKPTRDKSVESYGGVSAELPTTALPTHGDIARYFYTVKDVEKDHPTQIGLVKEKLENVWNHCNPALPLMDKLSLRRKLVLFIDKVRDFDGKKLKLAQKEQLLAVKDKLFDISACSCKLPVLPCKSKSVNCNAEEGKCSKIHIHCECGPEKRVPIEEREYLLDQRTKTGTFGGRFQFGPVDRGAARRIAKRQDRDESHARLLKKETSRLEENIQLEMSFGSESEISSGSSSGMAGVRMDHYNLRKLDHFIIEVIRYEISDRAAAALANGLMKDLGFISDSDTVDRLDAKKIQREKRRIGAQTLNEREPDLKTLTCIGLDGKKDSNVPILETKINEDGSQTVFKTTGSVHHLTFTVESGPKAGEYLTHCEVPGRGTGTELAGLTYDVLDEYESLNSLQAIILDNTATNTGHNNGLCACLERKLGRKVHMVGCMLHLNELPLRHVIKQLDGDTISGNKLAGPIGQQLEGDFYRNEPVDFQTVSTPLQRPTADVEHDLSSDQRILLEYMLGISSGTIAERFVKSRPGPLSHARWLTTATRILILYTRTPAPSTVHRQLVEFIQKVYGPFWFYIKQEKSFVKAPKLVHEMVQAAKKIDDTDGTITSVMQAVMQRSAFCFLPHNFMAALLFSEERDHRELAVKKIRELRSQPAKPPASTAIPKLNFDVEDWGDLINISEAQYEPPCTTNISDQDLEEMLLVKKPPPRIPIHTQSVERAVKLTSEACVLAFTWEKRHEYIVTKNKSRKQRTSFDSKKDYK